MAATVPNQEGFCPGISHALGTAMLPTPEEIALLEYEIASLRPISQAALTPCIRQVAR